MLQHMRTTILLPDELYDRVRLTAAAERRTVTSVIEEALRSALADRERVTATPPYRVDPISGGTVRPGVDLDDSAALADLMDDV
jgi:hypothetical protein